MLSVKFSIGNAENNSFAIEATFAHHYSYSYHCAAVLLLIKSRWEGKLAVVTGASAGIGLAIARAFVRSGLNVVGLARRKEKMESEMANADGKGSFYAYECDIANEQSISNAFQWIEEKFKTIHVIVNNAGVGKPGKIMELDFEILKNAIDVNLTGLLLCSKLAIVLMKEAHEAHIVNINRQCLGKAKDIADENIRTFYKTFVSSLFGHQVYISPKLPYANIYPATKFAVRALSEVLRREQNDGNIRITNISPGAVRTEMIQHSLENLERLEILEPEDIANAIIYAIGTPSRVQIEELTITPAKILS
ncbi:hypothetical protein TSAR_011238 [Trichomalopsis sarcophagae]|uniref:Farnesol dehydrogenase-like n=1 Tax=Trichomalopsis sarcophagae TaxID=543379 RepID=A0A232F2Y1_9HYME|nr:hypothetical protein TSAR_011238 [Trichomalopsis sarcophagae]